jgi:tungstate transport system permease protein
VSDLGELAAVALLSLRVSAAALAVALVFGLPAGAWLAIARFRGRRAALAVVNTGMGLPPVLVGLAVAMALWRSGPLGFLEILYTPAAMIVAQTIIALPVVVGLTASAVQSLGEELPLQLRALGASTAQVLVHLVREARLAVLAAVMAAFGAVISEVGAVMIVGGNLRGETRVLTTAIVMETRMGRFGLALALGGVLLLLTFGVNWALTRLQQREPR